MAERRSDGAGRRTIQLVLRGGLLVGSLLMAIGMVMALVQGRQAAHALPVSDIWHLVLSGDPSGVVALGVLVLVATPGARVLALVVTFLREHDGRFALVATAVAVLLAIGVVVGRA